MTVTPRSPRQRNPVLGQLPPITRADGSPIRVLLVDDEPALTNLLKMALHYEGWHIEVARDGREAITLAHLFDMTSGLAWTEPGRLGLLDDDELRLYWRADPARFVFERPLVSAPGTRWQYHSGGTAVLA